MFCNMQLAKMIKLCIKYITDKKDIADERFIHRILQSVVVSRGNQHHRRSRY